MTRRDWVLLLACGFALLPGCAHTAAPDTQELPLFEVPKSNPITTETPPPASPYHELPTPPPKVAPAAPPPAPSPVSAPVPPTETEIRPASYGPPEPSPAPPPAPPPPPPAPAVVKPAPEPAAVAALRYLLDKRPEEALPLLNAYSQPNQDLLVSLLSLSARLAEPGKGLSSVELAAAITQLEHTAEELRTRAALVLDKMCFCQWIDKFGVFEALPDNHRFGPGSVVHIYVELRNFSSETIKNCYCTSLASTVQLLDAQDKPVHEWSCSDRNRVEYSESLRHDYFINYSLRMPENLPPGKYKLVLHVEDLPTHRCAVRGLELNLTTRPEAD